MNRVGLLALLLVTITACAKKPAPSAKSGTGGAPRGPTSGKPKSEERMNVVTTAGSADTRDPVKNVRLYTVKWKSAALTLGRAGVQEGKMNGVSGTVYEQVKGVEKARSTFTADSGFAKKETQTLFLEGRVVVISPAYKATLKAKKLEWLPDVKRYRATGNVTLTTPDGISGPWPELLAAADLRRFGTPKLFNQK